MSGPSRTFIFGGELSYRVTDYTRKSRFVLYENGAFVLQYDPILPGEEEYRFRGQYHDANGVIMFMFAWEGPMFRPSDATGTLKGDSLTVRYEEGMHHADFEDAVYVLMP